MDCVRKSGGWLQGIQYFRAIAVIEVIVFHVTEVGLFSSALWTVTALSPFMFFGVPHFIFISGVVLYNKYNNGFSLPTFYKKRFNSVLPPYLVWSTFYVAFYYGVPTVYTYLFHHPTAQLGSNQSCFAHRHVPARTGCRISVSMVCGDNNTVVSTLPSTRQDLQPPCERK